MSFKERSTCETELLFNSFFVCIVILKALIMVQSNQNKCNIQKQLICASENPHLSKTSILRGKGGVDYKISTIIILIHLNEWLNYTPKATIPIFVIDQDEIGR